MLGRKTPKMIATRGFSLVELIVVIGLIGLLTALLLPALASSREQAKMIQCQSNLRQIGQALFEYANVYKGSLPSWSGWNVYPDGSSPEDEAGLAWTEELALTFGQKPDSAIYNCPSFPPETPMNYFLEARWSKLQDRHNIKFSDVKRSSQYILSGDCTGARAYIPPFGIATYTTVDVDKSDEVWEHMLFANEPGGLNIHRDGNNVLFADGHVACFRAFDVSAMTYDVNELATWDQVQGP